jgi:hypothetical protein
MKLPNNLSVDSDWSTIDLSSAEYTVDSNMTAPYTINTATINTSPWKNVFGTSSTGTVSISENGIEMQPGADIVIGGQSLTKTLAAINERLAILQPNTQLESEWEELKELGERYREMEQDLLEKARVWGILKAPSKR